MTGTMVPPVCKVEDCDRTGRITRGMCDMHYQRWHKNGTTELQPPEPRCSVDGCKRVARFSGLCRDHYGCWARTGSTERIVPPHDWVNPLVCVCSEPDADPRRNFGECTKCRRKPLALMAVPS